MTPVQAEILLKSREIQAQASRTLDGRTRRLALAEGAMLSVHYYEPRYAGGDDAGYRYCIEWPDGDRRTLFRAEAVDVLARYAEVTE